MADRVVPKIVPKTVPRNPKTVPRKPKTGQVLPSLSHKSSSDDHTSYRGSYEVITKQLYKTLRDTENTEQPHTTEERENTVHTSGGGSGEEGGRKTARTPLRKFTPEV